MPSQHWTQHLNITVQRTPTQPDRLEALLNSINGDDYGSGGQKTLYYLPDYPILLGTWSKEERNPFQIDLRVSDRLFDYNILISLLSMGQEVLDSDDPQSAATRLLLNRDSVVFKTITIKDGIELYIEQLGSENQEMGRVQWEGDLGISPSIKTTFPIPPKILRNMERSMMAAKEDGAHDDQWGMEISRYELIGRNTQEWDPDFLTSCLLPKSQISYVEIVDKGYDGRYAEVFRYGGTVSYRIAIESKGNMYTSSLTDRGVAFVERKFQHIKEGRFLIPDYFLK